MSLETTETLGFVSLASKELQKNKNKNIYLKNNVMLTRDLKFLWNRTGYTMATLHWSILKGNLFLKLLLEAQ